MQLADDADLAEALASPLVAMKPLLEFDWDRDGTYSHAYSNMTLLMVSADIDTATFQGDLPDEINAAIGSSSGQMTLTMYGRRNAEELTAAQLFNRYYTALSPLTGVRREGAPVRYSRKVRTKYGFRVVRQFTGWVSEIPAVNDETGEVTIICSDVYDLQTSPVTLPRWGKGPSSDASNPAVSGQYSYSHPIETSWVMEHLMLAAGRSRGPSVKSDTVAYWSCAGSFLPSVGSIVDTVYSGHAISYENNPNDWQYGVNGVLAPKATTHIDNRTLNFNRCRTPTPAVVPRNGVSGDAPQWTEISFWAYSDGSGSASGANGSQVVLWLDSASSGITPGFAAAFVNRSGRLTIQVQESTTMGSPRTWSWTMGTSLAVGWHYFSGIIAWTYSGISAVLHADDVVLSPTVSSPAFGFRYQQMLQNYEFGNVVFIKSELAPLQYVQIRHSATAITYDASQKNGVERDGELMAQVGKSQNQLTYIPNTTNKMDWDVLKDVVKAELGLMWTDEFGWLHFTQRQSVYNVEDALIADAPRLDRNKLGPFNTNPSANLYRNAVALTTTYSGSVRANVWTSDDAKERYLADGDDDSEFIDLPDDALTIYLNAENLSFNPPTTGVPLDHNYVASTRADNTALEPASGVSVNVIPQADQRTAELLWANTSGFPVYIGSYKDANQPAWFLNGTKLAPKKNGKFLFTDTGEVAETGGTQILEIPQSEWLQGSAQAEAIGWAVLADTVNPAPLIDPVSFAADPRRQLGDYAIAPSGRSMTGDLVVQIIGMRRIDKVGDSANDQLMLRVARQPGIMRWDDPSTGWDVGVWGE